MSAIGEGYAWPNLTVFSDGVRTVLLPMAPIRADAKPFRYLGAPAAILPRITFEGAVDDFLGRLLARLREAGIDGSNLQRAWADVLTERADPELSKRRKLEALLGRDPDTGDEQDVEKLVRDAGALGEGAVEELAAESGQANHIYTSEDLEALAETVGQETAPRNAVRLANVDDLRPHADTPAWVLGSRGACRLREQERLGTDRIMDAALARLAGVSDQAFDKADKADAAPISFSLDRSPFAGRIVFRSRWRTGRRFEVARLLGDRLIAGQPDRLRAATRAFTYRQKMQRAFAAEFLSPFDAVEAILSGDNSPEAREEAASHFDVSELTIRTLLVNHGRLEREELDAELAPAA